MSDVGIGEAGARLEMLVQQVASGRERVVITGDGGVPAAVLISPEELADLEDRLALAQYELSKARDTVETESHDEVVCAVYGRGTAHGQGAA
ncbi:type II toxin-antitoxin system Phd/YefM family antitoxin [Streptomyces synnematoformans]|uniref:Antitoxin n=1 Tax=Streptomyces synnematoformans TaxID=415721 RepID=A0ABN2XQ02_9ACTN